MSDEVKGTATHQQLAVNAARCALSGVMEHEAVGKCEAVSEIRGNRSGARKALVCKVKEMGVKTRSGNFGR